MTPLMQPQVDPQPAPVLRLHKRASSELADFVFFAMVVVFSISAAVTQWKQNWPYQHLFAALAVAA